MVENSDERDKSQALAVCGRLETYIENCLASLNAEAIVQCTLDSDDEHRPSCSVAVPGESLLRVKEILEQELRILSEVGGEDSSGINFEAVIPAMLKTSDAYTNQVFSLQLHESAEPPTHVSVSGDEPTTLKFPGDPNYGRSAKEIEHVIVAVHGIRDIGAWQNSVSRNLVVEGTVVEMLQYQLYPAIRFLWPWDCSGKPVKRVLKRMRALKNQYPNARMSVIAHSFGTYVTLKAIEADPDLEFWKIVFCGSVANEQFEWSDIKRRIGDGDRATKDFVLNDCGTGDIFPILGATFGWHYGMAGATGFSEGFIVNRFHKAIDGTKGGHGLYFSPEFVRQHWRPFLIEDQPPSYGNGTQGEDLPRVIKWLYHGWFRWVCRIFAWSLLAISLLIVAALLVRLAIATWPWCYDLLSRLFGIG